MAVLVIAFLNLMLTVYNNDSFVCCVRFFLSSGYLKFLTFGYKKTAIQSENSGFTHVILNYVYFVYFY
jgi:hypothetical protein